MTLTPHPAFGHPLPADAGRGLSRSRSFAPCKRRLHTSIPAKLVTLKLMLNSGPAFAPLFPSVAHNVTNRPRRRLGLCLR
jgi:hypothetical protein